MLQCRMVLKIGDPFIPACPNFTLPTNVIALSTILSLPAGYGLKHTAVSEGNGGYRIIIHRYEAVWGERGCNHSHQG